MEGREMKKAILLFIAILTLVAGQATVAQEPVTLSVLVEGGGISAAAGGGRTV